MVDIVAALVEPVFDLAQSQREIASRDAGQKVFVNNFGAIHGKLPI